MIIVFDVTVNGKVKETIQPQTQRLLEMHSFIRAESVGLIKKYGRDVCVQRRAIYN